MLEELKLLSAPKESIVNICSPFLRIQTDDTVVPVHHTVQEFLRSSHAPSITMSPQVNIPISSWCEAANIVVMDSCDEFVAFAVDTRLRITVLQLLWAMRASWHFNRFDTGLKKIRDDSNSYARFRTSSKADSECCLLVSELPDQTRGARAKSFFDISKTTMPSILRRLSSHRPATISKVRPRNLYPSSI